MSASRILTNEKCSVGSPFQFVPSTPRLLTETSGSVLGNAGTPNLATPRSALQVLDQNVPGTPFNQTSNCKMTSNLLTPCWTPIAAVPNLKDPTPKFNKIQAIVKKTDGGDFQVVPELLPLHDIAAINKRSECEEISDPFSSGPIWG